MSTSSKIRQAVFERQVADLQKQLGIPENYGRLHELSPCMECAETVSIGKDIFGRDQQMVPQAARAWLDMKDAAAANGIELLAVSAFRSVEYQAGIIRKKLDAGQSMEEILRVSAAPGYSEHHTGRALDVSTPGYEPLEEVFENSPAFGWLQKSGGNFGFRLSFPKNNRHGVSYEPWHWCWTPPFPGSAEV